MKIKETLLSWKEKLGKIDVPKLLASRAFLVGGCVLLVAVTITVSALMGGFFEGEPLPRNRKAASCWAIPFW